MRRISRVIQTIRDVILVLVSAVLISTSVGPGKEVVNYIFAGICGVLLALSVVNIILNVSKVKRKEYFYGNTIFQLAVGIFLLGLFAPLGVILLLLNLVIAVSLWEKKTPEELLKHPPKPVTTRHRVLIGAGVLVMLISLFFSWLSEINFPLIGFYFGTVDLTLASSLISSSPVATLIGLLTIVGAPVSLIIGALGLVRRRFAWASGALALIIGLGWILVLTAKAGLGVFIFVFGASIVLSALFIPNKMKKTKL